MRILALSLSVLCLSSAASASVLWRGDYETGDISQWSGYEGIPSRFTLVQSPLRQGKYALQVMLQQGDIASSGTRNEVENAGMPDVEGDDHWYSWSTLFPADFPAPPTWQVFTQWHHSGCCGSPPLEFDVLGETIQISHQGSDILWSAPLVRGVWHDFVIHVYFSSTAGYIEFWYDGQKALGKTPVQTLNPGEYDYLKQGLYRNASITQTATIYHDGMTMGTTMADVAPQLAAPVPPPPASSPDAGTVAPPPADAGTPSGPGAGPVAAGADAGTPSTPVASPPVTTSSVASGGGCSAAGGGSLALLGLLALALGKRRREASQP